MGATGNCMGCEQPARAAKAMHPQAANKKIWRNGWNRQRIKVHPKKFIGLLCWNLPCFVWEKNNPEVSWRISPRKGADHGSHGLYQETVY
jgi:hypothetical protein